MNWFKKIIAEVRMDTGRCPECNSKPPKQNNCELCEKGAMKNIRKIRYKYDREIKSGGKT